MALFPKARPTKAAKREPRPKRWPVHRCIASEDTTWSGEVICGRCGSPESFRVHQVDEEREALASHVDARRLGEAGSESTSDSE